MSQQPENRLERIEHRTKNNAEHGQAYRDALYLLDRYRAADAHKDQANGGDPMKRLTNKRLAAKIAADLFTNMMGQVADTIVLYKLPIDPGHNLGGWSQQPLADRIEKHLNRNEPIPRKKPAKSKGATT